MFFWLQSVDRDILFKIFETFSCKRQGEQVNRLRYRMSVLIVTKHDALVSKHFKSTP